MRARPTTGTRVARPVRLVLTVALAATLAGACGQGDDSASGQTGAAEVDGTGEDGSQRSDTTQPPGNETADDVESGNRTDEEGDDPVPAPAQGELFPDVIGATADRAADGSWTFSATLSSPYDSPERYADAWRVVGPDGEVYGVRELAHDHANEQPFTRSQSGIVIPDDVTVVIVEGRDQVSGWGGATVEVELPSS